MKVYIVLEDYSRESNDVFFEETKVHSVYASEEDANKAAAELGVSPRGYTYSDYTYYVEEHDLIDKQPQQ